LVWRRNAHLKSLFRDRREPGAAGSITDRTLEPHALRLERLPLPGQVAKDARLGDSVSPPRNDARRHQNETEQQECHDGPPGETSPPYSSLCHAGFFLKARK
jgi:hypothetical protein